MRTLVATALGFAATIGILASCIKKEEEKAAKAPTPATAPTSAPAPTAAAPVSEPPLTVERSAEVSVTAKVSAINLDTREVTLQDGSGRTVTFVAGPQIQRLNEVSVGDVVAAEYVIALVAELRPPTAAEAADPIAAVKVAGRAPAGSAPAGAAAEGYRVVTTVTGVDLTKMLVRLQGPLGDSTVVHAQNPENIKKLHVGDTVVITYVEAVGMSLVKAPK